MVGRPRRERRRRPRLGVYTKIALLLIKGSWRPTLSLSFALNQEEESHGHQDRFARYDLAHPWMRCGH